ncbi:MAG: hypothetical protein JXA28_09805, partial [Bacteroidetes bacterium]|nr:hypothetical protein [Bacteroidota bacterium]
MMHRGPVFLVILLLLPLSARSQLRFDPVVFLSTVNIHQYYGEGNIRVPDGVHSRLVDSVYSNNTTVGFSMLLSTDSTGAWTVWLDFDADRYSRPRLSRIFAQRPVGEEEVGAFPELRRWIETVQRANIGQAVQEDEDVVAWPWQRRTDYWLTIRRL